MTMSIQQLRSATDEQLIAEHDQLATSTIPGVNWYLDELRRRGQERQAKASEDLARQAVRLAEGTLSIAVVAIAVSVIAIFTA